MLNFMLIVLSIKFIKTMFVALAKVTAVYLIRLEEWKLILKRGAASVSFKAISTHKCTSKCQNL